LYLSVKDLPLYDYHCHLSPKEIYENKPFDNIGQLWLSGDHYKWRLMRSFGIEERLITGDADWKEKLKAYLSALEGAAGNPLYHWTTMELDRYFQITDPLTSDYADTIFQKANLVLSKGEITPRNLILQSGVRYLATTDDISDDLHWHELIAKEIDFPVKVAPSFRIDKMLSIESPDYPDYIRSLSQSCGFSIQTLSDLEMAVRARLDYFRKHGCRITDVGIPHFPSTDGDPECAQRAFSAALAGDLPDPSDYQDFISYMMHFCAILYAEKNMIMQLHLAVKRNVNSRLFQSMGTDIGCDCMGDPLSVAALTAFFDRIDSDSPVGLPTTILYALNPSMIPALASVAGCFPKIRLGAAWWFCDHKRGIREQLETIAEYSHLGTFTGMLTDSRSFLSYVRHDYFRRILCELLGEWVSKGEYPMQSAQKIAQAICCGTIESLLKEKGGLS
jgi:glucuronate isomerase